MQGTGILYNLTELVIGAGVVAAGVCPDTVTTAA